MIFSKYPFYHSKVRMKPLNHFALSAAICISGFGFGNNVIAAPLKTITTESTTIQQPPASRAIKGTILDEKNEPIPGAGVSLKGTTLGTMTDHNGTFSLNAAGNVTLVINYMGYQKKEVILPANQSTTKIVLTPENAELNEVVVIGFGTVKKRDLTGSVASVKAEDITKIPTHNALEAIQGRASGVDITRSSGAAGSGVSIQVRGNRSISGSNQPLYIIDGVQGASIDALNPNDIESIDVLKDASSTAIYGSQGANGVIIITTKKGALGKTEVNYDAFVGVNGFAQYPKGRTGEDYVNLRKAAAEASGRPTDLNSLFPDSYELAALQNNQWVDWVDLITQNGVQQSHSVSVKSGTEKTKLYLSGGYFKEDGLLKGNSYDRYNLRLNVDQKLSDWAKTGIINQLTYSDLDSRRDPLGVALGTSPLGVAYDSYGEINVYPTGNTSYVSPLTDERTNAYVNNAKATNVNAIGYVELTPIKGLSIRSNLGVTLSSSRNGLFQDNLSLAQYAVNYSSATAKNDQNRFYNWDNIINYNTNINKHNIGLTLISNYTNSIGESFSATGLRQQLSSQLFYNLISSDGSSRTISSSFKKAETMAYAARINYSYAGKYLLTLTGREDGASRLASGNKWDFFPAVAAGWNIYEEEFMKNQNIITNLKLRAGYGVSGNYGIDIYGTQSGISPGRNIIFGENAVGSTFIFNNIVGNADLGWEKSANTNIGLDFSILNGRVNLTTDIYNTKTTGNLQLRTLPPSTGGQLSVYQNIATTNNKGIELAINSTNILTKDFKWSSTLTFSKNKEKIVDLINGADLIASTDAERKSLLIGHPINSFFTYKKLGIWQLDEANEAAKLSFGGVPFKPGDIKLFDKNGDNIINNDDRMFIGSRVPKWFAGLQNTFSYKAFDMNVYMLARCGQTIDAEFLGRYNPSGTGNGPAIIDYWTPENPTNDFPQPKFEAPLFNLPGYQTLTFIDGSYFKVKTVSLGYTVPQKSINKIKLNSLRIFATASNLLTITKSDIIKSYDPERGGSESAPLSKQFVFGINLGL